MSLDSTDDLYEAIRQSDTDVGEISRQTGLRRERIQDIKEHIFLRVHWLDLYEDLGEPGEWGRFDSCSEIAEVWGRLRVGSYSPNDIQLLRHEAAEAWFMRKHGPSYRAAHRAAQRRYPWFP